MFSLYLYIRRTFSSYVCTGPWISSRCFFKDGSSSTPCMEFRMVTNIQEVLYLTLNFNVWQFTLVLTK